jgi:hypothetical protein
MMLIVEFTTCFGPYTPSSGESEEFHPGVVVNVIRRHPCNLQDHMLMFG